jgi:hypothetical protein
VVGKEIDARSFAQRVICPDFALVFNLVGDLVGSLIATILRYSVPTMFRARLI